MASAAGPTAIIKELCTYIGKEEDGTGNTYLLYKCPNTACKETERKVKVKWKSGLGIYLNIYKRACAGGKTRLRKQN